MLIRWSLSPGDFTVDQKSSVPTGSSMRPRGMALLGRLINPLVWPLDGQVPLGRFATKTAVANDSILGHGSVLVLCIDCAVGQRLGALTQAIATLEEKRVRDYAITVVNRQAAG